MTKEVILTKDAPAPIGPYSQAIKVNGMVFASGQIAIEPKSGNIIETTIEGQTKQVFANLIAVLKEAGSDLNKIVKTTVYLKEISEFPAMNKVYGEFFTELPPARSTVEVAKLPKDAKVEIDVIALI